MLFEIFSVKPKNVFQFTIRPVFALLVNVIKQLKVALI